MAITGNSRSERFSRWQLLVNNLRESGTLPHFHEEIDRLDALLVEARGVQVRYEHYRAQAREAKAELARLAREGDRVRGILGAGLRAEFGFTSESLLRYGYKPNQVNRRRPKAAPAPAAAAPTPAAADDPAKTEG
jgi:hypothetical protein